MIPLFKTHSSIGKSILRIDDVHELTKDFEEVHFVEDSMTGFPEAFRKFEDRLRFGLRFSIKIRSVLNFHFFSIAIFFSKHHRTGS